MNGMDYFYGFLIGIAGSLIASLLLSGGRAFWKNVIEAIFRRFYPPVAGRYSLAIVPKELMEDPTDRVELKLRQFGAKVSGEIIFYHHEKIEEKHRVEGKLSPSRYLRFIAETAKTDRNQYDAGLYRLENDGRSMQGFLSYICYKCEKVHSTNSSLTKLADQF